MIFTCSCGQTRTHTKWKKPKRCHTCADRIKKELARKFSNAYRKTHTRKVRNKVQKSGRTCGVCGKDPAPNYFYCPGDCFRLANNRTGDYDHEPTKSYSRATERSQKRVVSALSEVSRHCRQRIMAGMVMRRVSI